MSDGGETFAAKGQQPGNVPEACVEEHELTRFDQADEFWALLLPLCGHHSDENAQTGSTRASSSQTAEELPHSGLEMTQGMAHKDLNTEERMRRMFQILDLYQEQSYLLDPFLEKIVTPPIQTLQNIIRSAFPLPATSSDSTQYVESIDTLARLLYYFTKVRGYKTIMQFFPHAVHDLLPTLSVLEQCIAGQVQASWEARYILLLWLSLICMIPFDLSKLDESNLSKSPLHITVINRVEKVGKYFLRSSGKERDAAAVMLGRLLQRRDACQEHLAKFVSWSICELTSKSPPSIFAACGILQTLCYILKSLQPEALSLHIAQFQTILSLFSGDVDEATGAAGAIDKIPPPSIVSNSVVNKYKAKMACRLGLKMLRPMKKDRLLSVTDPSSQHLIQRAFAGSGSRGATLGQSEDANVDVPEEVDGYIGKLIDSLKDKDTIVRYSGAKGLSRICCRLPRDFVEQVVDEVTCLFSTGVMDMSGKVEDFSNVSEYTWQGCCLALAELARRGLLQGPHLGEQLHWIEKALLFDVRRGAHSVGTGVRDAACYAVWALARAHAVDAIRPHAVELSKILVCVALFDRDISIRRAASAAFQECVGRLGLFPHGIDVIRVTDFYAVGIRKNAYLVCAPQVAVHSDYRAAALHHLIKQSIIHWDIDMRQLGAKAIASILELDLAGQSSQIMQHMSQSCQSRDLFVLHGALLTQAEICKMCQKYDSLAARDIRRESFNNLSKVHMPSLRIPGTGHVLRAACLLISTSVSLQTLQEQESDSVWDKFVKAATERQEETVHEAAAEAISSVSHFQDCSLRIRETMRNWSLLNILQKQCSTKLLGSYDYAVSRLMLDETIHFLVSLVDEKSSRYEQNIETRCNAFRSLVKIVGNFRSRWSTAVQPSLMQLVWESLLKGLEDYSTDARGDIGSWIRATCIQGLRQLLELRRKFSPSSSEGSGMSQSLFDSVLSGVAKQMTDRIDSLRAEALQTFLSILRAPAEDASHLLIRNDEFLRSLFQESSDEYLNDPSYLYSRYVRLLLVEQYRYNILRGIISGIGHQRESINRPLAAAISDFTRESVETYSASQVLQDLVSLTTSHIRSNNHFIPCMQTFNVLLEDGVFEDRLSAHAESISRLAKILNIACRSIDRVKSVPRILVSMHFVTNLFSVPQLRVKAMEHTGLFLMHPFPTVRASAAELIYLKTQDVLDDLPDEAEESLLSTPWSQASKSELSPIVEDLIRSLTSSL